MPASLLASQLATLEPLRPDEPGGVFPADADAEHLAAEILQRLAEREEGSR